MRMPSIQLKAAALVPMPRVRQRIARMEKPGLRRSIRKPKRKSWRKVCISSLFGPKRFDWVYECCAPRGQETCKQCDQPENEHRRSKKRRIVRGNLVKLRSEQTTQCKSSHYSDNKSQ